MGLQGREEEGYPDGGDDVGELMEDGESRPAVIIWRGGGKRD